MKQTTLGYASYHRAYRVIFIHQLDLKTNIKYNIFLIYITLINMIIK